MSLNGSFYKYPVSQFGLFCEWSGVQSISGNYTDITLNVYVRFFDLEVGQRAGSIISINGVSETYTAPKIYDYTTQAWHNVLIKTKKVRVLHNPNGTKNNVTLSASWRFGGTYAGVAIDTITASTMISLDKITTYSLSISSDTGSTVTVNRTASEYGKTGNLLDGAILYHSDKLKVTFAPNANYTLSTHTVNGSTYISGNTFAVTRDVSVSVTSQASSSVVGATDANVGSASTIVVTKSNPLYYHSLQYRFGDLSGYITSAGGIQSTETKFSETSISFQIPSSFYAEIPDKSSEKCTITCRTYSAPDSTSVIGSPATCSIIITAEGIPEISGSVVDTNETTVALTGDNSKLIRYKSTATATISAIAKNSASIVSKFINGETISDNSKIYQNCSETSFTFKATDSRGYSNTSTVNPTIIAYIQLTINPILSRPTPTGNEITISFSGNFYRGSFGAKTNTLTIRYRYMEAGGTYGAWKTIDSKKVILSTHGYSSNQSFALDDEFNYQKEYHFQIQATDGTSEHPLSTVTKSLSVPRGVPVFDWGENDFNFNVPIMLNNINLLNIIYPIGSIYKTTSNTLPSEMSKIGAWEHVGEESINTTEIHVWSRTS